MKSIIFKCGDYDIELIGDTCRIYVEFNGERKVAIIKLADIKNALSTANMLLKVLS